MKHYVPLRTRVRHAVGGPVTVSDGGPNCTRVDLYGADTVHRAQAVVSRGRDRATWTVYDVSPEVFDYQRRCDRGTSPGRCATCAHIWTSAPAGRVYVVEAAGVYRCVCGTLHAVRDVVRHCEDCGERSAWILGGGLVRGASYYPPPPPYDSDYEAGDDRPLPGRAGDPREWYQVRRRDCCGHYQAKWGLPHALGRPVYAGRYRADRHGVFPAAFRRRAAAALAALGRRAERATAYAF